jgi:hypothetical protein
VDTLGAEYRTGRLSSGDGFDAGTCWAVSTRAQHRGVSSEFFYPRLSDGVRGGLLSEALSGTPKGSRQVALPPFCAFVRSRAAPRRSRIVRSVAGAGGDRAQVEWGNRYSSPCDQGGGEALEERLAIQEEQGGSE